ncbi:hypothetical protein COU57_03780 [Candidatus Pacearchaeota archaeon CG10_big_fil_rev_8_21_14_0_10_32_14]|nr:MAG: hypothetical protein COU57_03780 [Candidatus Pacearchaeota archaeon CG10_big_fil_rev_8_21_14_0_10_32_14]
MNRKKRTKKGIESIEKELEIHRKKLKNAIDGGNEELTGYYIKDIERLDKQLEKKKDILD